MNQITKHIEERADIHVGFQKYGYHVLFWLAFYLFFVLNDNKTEFGLLFTLVKELINVLFYVAIVYVNLYYLIPKYLKKKSFWAYLLSMLILVLMVTPIKTLVYFLLYSSYPDLQVYFLERQRDIFFSSFLVIIGSTGFKIFNDWAFHERERQELQKRSLESELNFLKSQINPHFLFNTLNNLYALTLKKSDVAPEIVLKLSEMMRYMLYECNERRVSLSKEINYLKNYLDLELIRQGELVEIDFKLDGHVDNQKVAPLVFIPFVENCFKHGLRNEIGKGYVKILFLVSDDAVDMEIKNSKTTSLPSQPGKSKSGGIGLVNVKKRLDLHYGTNYNLDITDNPNDFKVQLFIQLD